jgi:hypothetical protein
MNEQQTLLHQIELQWPVQIRGAIGDLIHRNPGEQFYAAAFWMFYCDHIVIHPPTFGMNAESVLEEEDPDQASNRWNPAEWRWNVVDAVHTGMLPIYLQLSRSMHGQLNAAWQALISAHENLIGRVTRSVTQAIRNRTGDFRDLILPEKFLIFAVDVREGDGNYNRLLRLSVDEAVLGKFDGILLPER